MYTLSDERIAIVGLGYVGLPVAVALARRLGSVIGFDINEERIALLRQGIDRTNEVEADVLTSAPIRFTSDPDALAEATIIIVAVPTPIDTDRRPDLTPVRKACESIGKVLRPNTIVVFESTVYPGVTEEFCGPILERVSGLQRGRDFKLAYSPERINPGDKEHTFERIVKIVAAEDEESLRRVTAVYEAVVEAGVHKAPSIKVAECAKVLENTQRDLNIALMNELALICDRIGIRTADVLSAARTKWNFVPFAPGLVGGHCIGVDPYYLTSKAQALGYHPEVILAGRRINDNMGVFIAQRLVKLMIDQGLAVRGARVGILGLTFKENVPDLRNSRVPDIINELKSYNIEVLVHDPLADREEAAHEYGVRLWHRNDLVDLSALVIAVAHRELVEQPMPDLLAGLRPHGVLIDVRSAVDPSSVPEGVQYWSL